MTTDPTIPALAGKLTAKQREALLAERGSVAVCRALYRKGLAHSVSGTGMNWDAYPNLNAKGREVAHHLRTQGGADDA